MMEGKLPELDETYKDKTPGDSLERKNKNRYGK
jgi:hypothetical protein